MILSAITQKMTGNGWNWN